MSGPDDRVDERDERRIAQAAPICELPSEERRVVLPARQLNTVVLGI